MRPVEGRVVALAACALMGACSTAAPKSPEAVSIRAATVSERSIAAPVELSGNVVAARQSILSAPVTGRLIAVGVRVGSRVRAGDTVAAIDGSTYRAQQEQARGDVARARAEEASARSALAAALARLDLARVTRARTASLAASGDVSRQTYDQANSEYLAAEAAVAQARSGIGASAGAQAAASGALLVASSQLAQTLVRAPYDGTIVQKLADPGTIVVPGTPVVQLQDDSALEVDLTLPQDRAAAVRAGQEIAVRFDAAVQGGAPVRGRIESVTAMEDPALRSVLVKIQLPPVRGVMPGMYARVDVRGAAQRGVAVPLAALVTRAGQTGVFAIANGVATFAPVRTGPADASFVLVEGLREGDRRVAVDDTSQLTDGAPVTVRP